MLNLLRRIFIKDYQNVKNEDVRVAHGKLSAFFGIFTNLLIACLKIVIGILTLNISIISDSVNNFSDMASCFIVLIGFNVAKKPADKEHPFGHQRVEYIAGLIISVIIIVTGVTMIYTSIEEIIKYEYKEPNLIFSYISIGILAFSILVKLYQALFNIKMSKLIQSDTLKATAIDSRNDCIATSLALIGIVIEIIAFSNNTIIPLSIDGIFASIISLYIIYSGIMMLKESIDPLIGNDRDIENLNEILEYVESNTDVLGIHDVMCHSYGPTKKYVVLHVEMNSSMTVLDCHRIIDDIEKYVKKNFDVNLTIHADPVEFYNIESDEVKFKLNQIIKKIDPIITFHDFSLYDKDNLKILSFDLVTPYDYKLKDDEVIELIKNEFDNKIYGFEITIDHN